MGINGSSWAAGFHSHGDNGFQVERSDKDIWEASHGGLLNCVHLTRHT